MPYWCLVLRFHIFFFSSRRRHTRFKCDWSSDVCSSDLKEVQRDRTQDQFFAPDVMKTSEHGFPTHRLGGARFRFHLYPPPPPPPPPPRPHPHRPPPRRPPPTPTDHPPPQPAAHRRPPPAPRRPHTHAHA